MRVNGMAQTAHSEDEPYVLEIELPADAQQDLRTVLNGLGLNGADPDDLGDAFGTALSMEAFLLEEAQNGSRIWIVDKNGQRRELLVKPRGETRNGRRAGNY
jgi:hypothetical protein